jgi:Tfp pilus assembly protein PilN
MPVNNLNLLPPELSVSKNLNQTLKAIRALGVIGIAAFLVFGIGVGAFFIISTISLNGINANVVRLTGQISAQQKSEQQIFLVKDRIAKILTIQQFPNSLPNLETINSFLSNLSANSLINEISIDSGSVNLSVNLKTNSDLSTFLESLQSSGVFKSIIITSFKFNTASGYALEIMATR